MARSFNRTSIITKPSQAGAGNFHFNIKRADFVVALSENTSTAIASVGLLTLEQQFFERRIDALR